MSNEGKTTALAEQFREWPDTPLAHRRPEYPLAGCFPEEPASVSPGVGIASEIGARIQPLDIGAMPQKIHGVFRTEHVQALTCSLTDSAEEPRKKAPQTDLKSLRVFNRDDEQLGFLAEP